MSLVPAGEEIWLAEGGQVSTFGMHFGCRSVVVRLADRSLWVHSPINLSEELQSDLARLGDVRYLVAPNNFHHLFLSQWQARFPDTAVYAATGVARKQPDLHIDAQLSDETPAVWQGVIEQVVFKGHLLMDEVVFYHPQSETLILTDLVLNVRTDEYNLPTRFMAWLDQVAFPNGGTPRFFRWGMRDKKAAAPAVQQILAWSPRQVVFAHGEWFRNVSAEQLKSIFSWIPITKKVTSQ